MGIFRSAGLAVLIGGAAGLPALAQTAKPDSAEAAAAMERAQRLAANPMRVILEAGKFKRKGAPEVEAAPVAADGANLRRTAARSGEAETVAAREEIVPRSAPAPKAAPVVAPAPTPASESISTLLSTSTTLEAPSTVPDLAPANLATAVAPVPQAAAAPLPALAATLVRPKLASSVEPVFPPRYQEEASRLTEVLADLTLRADGSVAEVAVMTPMQRPLQRAIVAAMEQWRFEPLPSQRVHRVQLVFNETK